MNQNLNRWLLILIPLTFAVITPWPLSETGLWIGYGKHLFHSSGFLYRDSISILPTSGNVTCAWLISLLYYGLYLLGDLFEVAFFHFVVLILTLLVVYRQSIFNNPWPWKMQERLPIYVMLLGTAGFYSMRPALVAFLPFIFSFILLERRGQKGAVLKPRDWLWLLLLQIFWVNLHGSFVLLPLMLFWFLITRPRLWTPPNWISLGAVLSATLINPFGYQVYPYIFKTKELSDLLGVTEWASAFSWVYPTQTVLYWGLLVYVGWMIFRAPKAQRPWSSVFIPILLLPLFGLRNSAFAFLALPVFLNYQFANYRARAAEKEGPLVGSAFACTLILAILLMGSPYLKHYIQNYLPEKIRPAYDEYSVFAIADEIRKADKPQCAILNDFNVGGFLMMITENPLLIDGRITPFTREAYIAYGDFITQKNISVVMGRTKACFAVLSQQTSGPLILQLQKEYGFKPMKTEGSFVLLGRL